MSRPDTPTPITPRAADDHEALRRVLLDSLELEPTGEGERSRLDAFRTRALQAWAHEVGAGAVVPDAVAARPRPVPARRPPRGRLGGIGGGGSLAVRPGWVGGLGLAALLLVAVLAWQHHQREALLDELSQIDVLSQMAAGEM